MQNVETVKMFKSDGCIQWGQFCIWTEIHWNCGLFQSNSFCDYMKHCLTSILFNEAQSQPGFIFS